MNDRRASSIGHLEPRQAAVEHVVRWDEAGVLRAAALAEHRRVRLHGGLDHLRGLSLGCLMAMEVWDDDAVHDLAV
jgi:hypothetical protein